MLISYPILPAGADSQSEQARLEAMLELTQSDRGLYPVTSGNRWHGGIHLTPGDEPLRAIADGVILAYRLAPDTKDYPGQGAYDTSFVLIKHETDSGEHTRVVFYSLYMHLRPKGLLSNAQREQLLPFLRNAAPGDAAVQAPANTRIWRKDVLGFAGQVYGHPTVHFEIFATEADFNAFWRDRTAIAAGSHGSEDVFGHSYFIIPAGRAFADRHPRAVAPHRIDLPGNAFYDLPVGQAGHNADRLLVVVRLDAGQRTATSFRLDAQGRIAEQIGQPLVQDDYEYELYRLATALYPDCPSAGFEYLRFGRILGPDTTTRVENWQLIRYSDTAVGYINLADPAHQISVLSDADFPILWQRLEEGEAASPADGIANVARLTELLNLPAEPAAPSLSAPADFAARDNDANVAAILRSFICKHPSEWDASDLEARYAALRQPGKPLHADSAWQAFKEHVEAMAFWPQTGITERSVWHFHPLQFVQHYRRCGWLSHDELAQTLPNHPGYTGTGAVRTALNAGLITLRTARQRTASHVVSLNNCMRKYGISNNRVRQTQFLAQVMLETDKWQTMVEYGRGATNARLPMTQYYAAFYGRGIMQLTWAGNYASYGSYRSFGNHNGAYTDARITATSTHYWDDPTERDAQGRIIRVVGAPQTWSPRYDPETISQSQHDACDSGGFYWASKSHNRQRDINRVSDRAFDESSIGRISILVNGGGNGYYERQAYARYAFRSLSDNVDTRRIVRYPTNRNNIQIDVDFTRPT